MSSVLKVLKKVYSVFEWIAKWLWYIAGAAMVIMAIIVTIGAVARYAFRSPIAISYDLTCLFMTICAMLSLPYVQCQRENLRLNLFDRIFPAPVVKALSYFVTPILSLVFSVVITKECWDQAIFAREIGEVTKGNFPYPSFPVKLMITACIAILCIVLLLQFLIGLCSIGRKEALDGGADK